MEREASREVGGFTECGQAIARIPKPYRGDGLWREEWQSFLDDMDCNGWTKTEALPHLVSWLKEGPGKVAVNQWRDDFGYAGTFDDLVQTASYLFGTLINEDPMATFRKRTQKPHESHKIFGIELQHLLHKARPTWRKDDECFMHDLFKQFIDGLKDGEQRSVAYEAWKADAALTDIFLAIDNHNTKKVLMAGRAPQRISAYQFEDNPGTEEDMEQPTEEEIAAMDFKGKFNKPQGKWKDLGEKKKWVDYRNKADPNAAVVKKVEAPVAVAPLIPDNLYEEILKKLQASLQPVTRRTRPFDKSGKRCYDKKPDTSPRSVLLKSRCCLLSNQG